jgi:hypothetical protein
MKASCTRASKQPLVVTLVAVILFCTLSLVQRSSAQQTTLTTPSPLIAQPIDESHLTVLHGNTYPLARPQFDLGTAPATLPMQRMLLVLKRSAQQEAALRKLLDDQQDKASPNYHKWLTPAEYGKQFGPTDADIQTITSWLQSHGFEVGTTKGRTVLEFSGSASQVQEAFHTTIHKYIVNGEQHWANANDPQIPTALLPAMAGVATLHNFLKKPQLHLSENPVAFKVGRHGDRPSVTFPAQNGQPAVHALGPQDFATIYDSPAFSNTSIAGQGVIIGVVARSNLFNEFGPANDVGNFRSVFGLPFTNTDIFLNGPDPGDLGGDEEAEVTLDATWSGAVATEAGVEVVVSATTNTSDGIDLSEVYIVENNFADIMTESFSSCELYATDAQLAFSYALAEQAAAQGITYFVSTGDDGAEGCDDPSMPTATHPISVNLLASTPFNLAVGGTMFNENGQDSNYWGTEQPIEESAISYIPEDVWNESSAAAGLWASSGGASAGNIANGQGGSTPGIPKPSWQSGVTGIPNDLVRDLPDVSLTAAGHDPYLLCLESSCAQNLIYFASGTSAAAPSFAGIMALVDGQMANLNPSQGPRQGQAGYVLYRLAFSQNGSLAQCNASNTSALPASTCIFNDVTVGNNAVPGELNYGSPDADYQAGVGYDMTTGLGSVNVTNLVNQWSSVTFNPTTTTLTLTPMVNITHGSSVDVAIAVSPSSGTGKPSGDVSLLAATGAAFNMQTAVDGFTLSGASSVASSTSQLPGGGPYNVTAHYAGDATYAPSNSSPVSIAVTPEPSTTTLSVLTVAPQGNAIPFTGGPFGSFIYLRADVAGKSGHGTPTGSITFTDTFGPIPAGNSFLLNSGDQLNNGSNTATPNGATFDAGNHAISASYGGDASFNASSSSGASSFTIQPGFFAAVPSNQSEIPISAPGESGSTSVNVSYSSGFSGTITLACSGLPSGAACLFSQSPITATGTLTTTSSAITVTTTAAGSTAMLEPPHSANPATWPALAGFVLFSVVLVGASRRQHKSRILLAMFALIVLAPGCGGGGGSSNHGPPPNLGTPAGTYNVTVNAVSGSTTSTTGFILIVQ